MANTFFCSDHHFGHQNTIIKFQRNDGSPLRDFPDVTAMNEHIIEEHNKLVKPHDKVYFLGDVVINRKMLPLIARMNGDKVLYRGNHDIFRMADYAPYFRDLRGVGVMAKHGIVFGHIPFHPDQMYGRFRVNVHGHKHADDVLGPDGLPDPKYINVCVDHKDIMYKPVSLDQILSIMEARGL